ncbi:MAG: NAD(P)H-dependent glycerol-3-phosphate dehydrogenase [Gammaproteobacteria bacterium]|nr:NAD(P)H-dependent glycerol-3-phosphate dehydrogenase [Gammaproteobacteria bacterium]
MQAAIVGAGNFGTAVANIVAGNGVPTQLWMRDLEQLAEIRAHGENRRYLPGHPLERLIVPTSDLVRAVCSSDVVFVTVPSASFREVAGELRTVLTAGACVISATKGIEADGFKLMSQILEELLPKARIGVISGPNLAEEMADGRFSGTVVASRDDELRSTVQEILKSPTFRVYSSTDVYGVELGGALKNIYAIVAGLATTLDIGQNALAMLITRSLAEMGRFAVALGANPFTFLGLAGVGDLFATCTSPLSRNFQLGARLARGSTLAEAMESLGKLAEGVNTVRVVHAKSSELGVYMPLADGLYRMLFEGADLATIVHQLMTSTQRMDVEFAAPTAWSYQQ